MKSPYVNELKPNQLVETSFLVQSKEIRQKKGGELYNVEFETFEAVKDPGKAKKDPAVR